MPSNAPVTCPKKIGNLKKLNQVIVSCGDLKSERYLKHQSESLVQNTFIKNERRKTNTIPKESTVCLPGVVSNITDWGRKLDAMP